MLFVEVPILAPINVVDINRTLPANYHQKHFDSWTATEQIQPFETHKCDLQKWQFDDIVFLQLKANFSPVRLVVRNSHGLIVLSQEMSIVAAIAGDIYFQDQIAFDDPVFEEGFYVMEIWAGDPVLITLQATPFYLKEQHEQTHLVKYSSSYNNKVLWEFRDYMTFRVDGVIMYDRPGSVRTVYVDQPGSEQTVKGDAFRFFKWYVGVDGGLPNWQIDKLEEIIDQTFLEIDNKGFSPSKGADWNTKKVDRYPWAQWNIEMRETNNRRARRFEVDGLQEKKVAIDYIVEGKLFGAIAGSANDNTYTINSIE